MQPTGTETLPSFSVLKKDRLAIVTITHVVENMLPLQQTKTIWYNHFVCKGGNDIDKSWKTGLWWY
jgi:hypothetical protein